MIISFCDTAILCRNQQSQKEFRNFIKIWLRTNHLNKRYLNEETGYTIFINITFIDKVTSKFGDVKVHALTSLQEIIKNAIFVNSAEDTRKRLHILNVLKFESLIDVDGERYNVWLYVRQTKNDYQLYSLNIKV